MPTSRARRSPCAAALRCEPCASSAGPRRDSVVGRRLPAASFERRCASRLGAVRIVRGFDSMPADRRACGSSRRLAIGRSVRSSGRRPRRQASIDAAIGRSARARSRRSASARRGFDLQRRITGGPVPRAPRSIGSVRRAFGSITRSARAPRRPERSAIGMRSRCGFGDRLPRSAAAMRLDGSVASARRSVSEDRSAATSASDRRLDRARRSARAPQSAGRSATAGSGSGTSCDGFNCQRLRDRRQLRQQPVNGFDATALGTTPRRCASVAVGVGDRARFDAASIDLAASSGAASRIGRNRRRRTASADGSGQLELGDGLAGISRATPARRLRLRDRRRDSAIGSRSVASATGAVRNRRRRNLGDRLADRSFSEGGSGIGSATGSADRRWRRVQHRRGFSHGLWRRLGDRLRPLAQLGAVAVRAQARRRGCGRRRRISIQMSSPPRAATTENRSSPCAESCIRPRRTLRAASARPPAAAASACRSSPRGSARASRC